MATGLREKFYNASPLWLQHGLVSLQGLEFRLRRTRVPAMRRYLEALLVSQRWSAGEHAQHQFDRLKALLAHAFARVPYYREMARELGVEPGDIRSIDDFQRLPVLEKAVLRTRSREFLADGVDSLRCRKSFTSGTTGTPLELLGTLDQWCESHAYVARLRVWAGLSDPFYPRRVQFTGRDIVPATQDSKCEVLWRHNLPGRALLCSSSHISRRTARSYAEAMGRFQPELVDGYPSAMLMLARTAAAEGLALPRPKGIITSAETLTSDARREIEQGFGCRVFDQYASTDPGSFWTNCEAGRMHMHPEYGLSEILRSDGTACDPGEEGDVVSTCVFAHAMPLIRYRNGDRAIPSREKSCPCGRQMPLVERVVGRVDDILFVPDRGYVGRLDPVFKGLHGIVEARIVQEQLELLRVLVVPGKDFTDASQQLLETRLRAKVGRRIAIRIDKVDAIPRGPNGKFRSVVTRVKHLYPDPPPRPST